MATSFLEELSMYVLSLSEQQGELFLSPLYWVLLANGDADFHDNVIFFGFDSSRNDPMLVAKVPRLIENGWMLKTEYDHLLELWNCIGPEAVNYIPRTYGMTTLQGRPVLVISYIAGQSLTRLSLKSFWMDSQQVSALAREAARSLRDLNRLTEQPIYTGDSLKSDFAEKADTFRKLFKLSLEEDHALAELVKTVDQNVARADHKVIIQGDFWHGNMIRDEQQRSLRFVDWQFARWSSDVSLDVYFFLVAGALSAVGDQPPELRAKDAFHRLCDWRADVIPEYLSTYGTPDHFVLLPPKDGMMFCCVEKAVRSALDFGYSHPDDLVWRNLFAELLHWQPEP